MGTQYIPPETDSGALAAVGVEQAARIAADTALSTAVGLKASTVALNAETASRTDADTALDGRLDTVESSSPYFGAAAPTQAAILAAVALAEAALDAGAAKVAVLLPDGGETGIAWSGGELPKRSGLHYVGVPLRGLPEDTNPKRTSGAHGGFAYSFDTEFEYTGGSWFAMGTDTYLFEADDVSDRAEAPLDITDDEIRGFSIRNVGVDGGKGVMRSGAANRMGVVWGEFDMLVGRNCTDEAFYMKNFARCDFGRLWSFGCAGAGLFAADCEVDLTNPGNSDFKSLYAWLPRFDRGATTSQKARGFRFLALKSGQQNEIDVHHIQVNRHNNTLFAALGTFTNGSTDVTVPDGTLYEVGMLVSPASTGLGFTVGLVYVVRSVVGNVITLAAGHLSALTAATASNPASTATTSSGSPNLTLVSPTTGWANGMTVVGAGIPAGATIASGAGTATMVMSANATASAAGVAVTGYVVLNSYGRPNVEVIGSATASVSNIRLGMLDSEGAASADLYVEKVSALDAYLTFIVGSANCLKGLVARTSVTGKVRSAGYCPTDIGAGADSLRYEGRRGTGSVQYPGVGMVEEAGLGNQQVLHLSVGSGSGLDFEGYLSRRSGGFTYPGHGMGERIYQRDTSITLGGGQCGTIISKPATGITFTLPTIVDGEAATPGSSHVGIAFDIVNLGPAAITLPTGGSQTINKVTGLTSLTIPAGTRLKVTAAKEGANVLFWKAEQGGLAGALDMLAGKTVPALGAGDDAKALIYDHATGAFIPAAFAAATGPQTTLTTLTADLAITSTTRQDVPGFGIAIGASATEVHRVLFTIDATAVTATVDIYFGWTVPAGCVVKWGLAAGAAVNSVAGYGGTQSGTANLGLKAAADILAIGLLAGQAGIPLVAKILGGGTAGTAQLQAAQLVSEPGNLKLDRGSLMEAIKVAA